MLRAVVCIAIGGALGGIVNAIMVDKGFMPPSRDTVDGVTILRPGWVGNVIIGIVAAVVSWGLYGPLAQVDILHPDEAAAPIGVALSSLVGAVLVGIAGARWLTNEVDKNVLRVAASKAAGAPANPELSRELALASPFQALEILKKLG
jgi:hypothetical protein